MAKVAFSMRNIRSTMSIGTKDELRSHWRIVIGCRFTEESDRWSMSLSRDEADGIDVQAPRL